MLDIRFNEEVSFAGSEDTLSLKRGPVYKIGVVSRFSPSLLYRGYQPLISYLNKRTPYTFQLHLNKTYSEAVQELASGRLQAAFLGTYVFLTYMNEQPIHAFLAPLSSDGQPHFRIVLLTREDFPYRELTDFSSKKIGVPSPLSFSGNWLQKYVLPQIWPSNLLVPQFISYDFHHTVVQHVLRGDLAGGVVKDRVANEYAGKGIRIIRKSRFIPASPLVQGPASDAKIIQAISTVLADIPAKDKPLLQKWDAEFHNGFLKVNDRLYIEFKQKLENAMDVIGVTEKNKYK